jgi:hypothetical protein
MFRVRRLEGLPDNFDEFVVEIAAGLHDLYGPRAAEAYRRTASSTVGGAVSHPAVEALAVDDGPQAAGFLLSLTRLNVAQISFIHVLHRYAERRVEQLLLEELVLRLRNTRVEGIVALSNCFLRNWCSGFATLASKASWPSSYRCADSISTRRTPNSDSNGSIVCLWQPGSGRAGSCRPG